jgi:preprotein translocase SecE subunit
MQDTDRYVSIAYVVLGLIAAWVLAKTAFVAFDALKPSANIILFLGFRLSAFLGIGIAGAVTLWLWNHQTAKTFSEEVAIELQKVTWPDREERQRSTIVVIVFSVVLALFLALFDVVWKFATDIILAV